jgi:hypothetical protein
VDTFARPVRAMGGVEMPKTRREFSPEFEREAVVLANGGSRRDGAIEVGGVDHLSDAIAS